MGLGTSIPHVLFLLFTPALLSPIFSLRIAKLPPPHFPSTTPDPTKNPSPPPTQPTNPPSPTPHQVLRAQTSLAAPLVILFVGGAMLSGTMSMLITLLVDLYPQRASTAMAGLNLCRCSMSAAGTASVEYIIAAWGLGWTYTFIGGLMLVLSVPALAVVVWRGPVWREERHVRLERKEEAKRRRREEREEQQQRGGGEQVREVEDKSDSKAVSAAEEEEKERKEVRLQTGGGAESDKRE